MKDTRDVTPPSWWENPPEQEEPKRYKCRCCGRELDRLGYAADEEKEYTYCLSCVYDVINEESKTAEQDFLKQLIYEEVMNGENCFSFEQLFKSED